MHPVLPKVEIVTVKPAPSQHGVWRVDWTRGNATGINETHSPAPIAGGRGFPLIREAESSKSSECHNDVGTEGSTHTQEFSQVRCRCLTDSRLSCGALKKDFIP